MGQDGKGFSRDERNKVSVSWLENVHCLHGFFLVFKIQVGQDGKGFSKDERNEVSVTWLEDVHCLHEVNEWLRTGRSYP